MKKQTPITKTKTPDISDEDVASKLTQSDFDRASFQIDNRQVSKTEWQGAVRSRVGKKRINIMLDAPIIEYFKAEAGERGYQTLINETLRKVIEAGKIEADLRKVIREELRTG